MRSLVYRLFLVKLVFAVVLLIQGQWYWLINFELAFFASLFIILGSFSGYKRMVERRLEAGNGVDDGMLEQIEDPYELYDENSEANEDIQITLSEVIKEEKKRLKENKETLKKTLKSTPGIFSPWRFLPYIMLVLSFIGLNNNHVLDIPAFLIGLAAGITAAIFVGKAWLKQSSPL